MFHRDEISTIKILLLPPENGGSTQTFNAKAGDTVKGIVSFDMTSENRPGNLKVGIYGICMQHDNDGSLETNILYDKRKDIFSFDSEVMKQRKEKTYHFDIQVPLMWELCSPTICEISREGKLSI